MFTQPLIHIHLLVGMAGSNKILQRHSGIQLNYIQHISYRTAEHYRLTQWFMVTEAMIKETG